MSEYLKFRLTSAGKEHIQRSLSDSKYGSNSDWGLTTEEVEVKKTRVMQGPVEILKQNKNSSLLFISYKLK